MLAVEVELPEGQKYPAEQSPVGVTRPSKRDILMGDGGYYNNRPSEGMRYSGCFIKIKECVISSPLFHTAMAVPTFSTVRPGITGVALSRSDSRLVSSSGTCSREGTSSRTEVTGGTLALRGTW